MDKQELDERCGREQSFIAGLEGNEAYKTEPVFSRIYEEAAKFVNNFCDKPLPAVEEFTETVEKKISTRTCVEERETSQFVCEAWDINKDEMDFDEWKTINTTYTYSLLTITTGINNMMFTIIKGMPSKAPQRFSVKR